MFTWRQRFALSGYLLFQFTCRRRRSWRPWLPVITLAGCMIYASALLAGELWYQAGVRADREQGPFAALPLISRAEAIFPLQRRIRNRWAYSYTMLNANPLLTSPIIEAVLAQDPHTPTLLYQKAIHAMNRKDFDLAERTIDEIEQLSEGWKQIAGLRALLEVVRNR